MSPKAQTRKNPRSPAEPVEIGTIDLTKEICRTTEPVNNDISASLPKAWVTEGVVYNKQKNKTGEVGIDWVTPDELYNLRAEQLLKGIKKRETSGEMLEKQLEFTKKLAQFEAIRDAIDVEKGEVAASHLSKIPHPDWITHPRLCGDGSKMPGDGVSLARGVYHKYANNKHFLKTIKPANCLKYMNIEAHPHLLKEWYMEALGAQAAAVGVTIVEVPALCHRTVAMSRTLPRELVHDQEQMLQLSELRKNSMRFLYILLACDVTELLKAEPRDLSSHMAGRKRTLGGQITVIILDAVKYFKKGKPLNDLNKAIEDMLITLEIDTLIVHTAEELATLILQYTKAVAEEPAKLAKRAVDDQAEFYMRGDNKNCVTVDQNGNGRDRLWQQMLSVLPQSSLEVSRAIAGKYASPRLLAQALSKEGGVSSLASLGVARSAAPDARARKLGPEMANKLHQLFTIKDGDFVVE